MTVLLAGAAAALFAIGTFLILQGVNLAVTKLVTDNVATDDISDMDGFGQATGHIPRRSPVAM